MARQSFRISLATTCLLGLAFLGWISSAEARPIEPGPAPVSTSGSDPALAGPATSAPTDAGAPWITTRGTQFIDTRTGKPASLHGVNAMLGPQSTYASISALHVTFVRIVISWDRFEPNAPINGVHEWDADSLQKLDAEIAWFRNLGVNVMLDFHQGDWSSYFTSGATGIPAWYYANGPYALDQLPQAEAAFWTSDSSRSESLFGAFATMIATRYRSTPNVLGYDIFNEPPPGALGDNRAAFSAISQWEANVRNQIQVVDPLRAVVLSCCALGPNEALWTDFSSFGNLDHLAFDFHDYWPGSNAQNYSETFADQLAHIAPILNMTGSEGIPLMVGEWGIPTATSNGAAYQSQMLHVFNQDSLASTRWFMWPNDSGKYNLLGPGNTLTTLATQLAQAWSS